MLVGIALLVSMRQTTNPDVDELLKKMHAAYAKIHSIDMTIMTQIGTPEKYFKLTSRIRYQEPNLFREDISESVASDPAVKSFPGFTYICDGKNEQLKGRADGKDGIKPFSRAAVQDDGAPVYKEALLVWDWDRQWSAPKGGTGYHYEMGSPTVKGKKYIGLSETVLDKSECFQYFINPDTYLIERTLYYLPGDGKWIPAGNYVVQKFEINPTFDPAIFQLDKS